MRILITGIGGDLGQLCALTLRRHYPDIEILGIDAKTPGLGATVADRVAMIPKADSGDYLDELKDLVSEFTPDLILPASDAEVALLVQNAGMPLPPVLAPGKRVVEICQDKLATVNFLGERGVAVPISASLDRPDNIPFPCIIKPRMGQGSKNVTIVESFEQASIVGAQIHRPMLQELLEPSHLEYTCAVVGLSRDDIRVFAMERVLRGGSSAWVRSVSLKEIEEYCLEVASHFSLRGPINIQLIVTDDGPRLFEINPRLSSTVLMRDMLGFPDLYWMTELLTGHEPPRRIEPTYGRVAIRVPSVDLLPHESDTWQR